MMHRRKNTRTAVQISDFLPIYYPKQIRYFDSFGPNSVFIRLI